MFLPIKCNKITFVEIEIKNKIVPFDEVEEKIKKQAFEEAKKKVFNSENIKNVTYSVVTENGITRVDCFIETIMELV